jgi:hypothetical protein
MHRRLASIIRFLAALLLAVCLVVPTVEAMTCSDQMDEGSSQEVPKPSDQKKDQLSAHGHCHHGGALHPPFLFPLRDVVVADEPMTLVTAGNLPSDRLDGLIRPPRG